ncbi:hypothetical protein ACLK1Y_18185 [Escherichia coli]
MPIRSSGKPSEARTTNARQCGYAWTSNHHTRDAWLDLLTEAGMTGFPHPDYPDAVRLETPASVLALPGFEQGWVTVQDASARLHALSTAGKR